MAKLLVVVGITGQQGGSVANIFSREPGWKVRGLTRDPSKATPWEAKGVEVVKADLNDKESLITAFQGAYAIFSNTDFWSTFYNPATPAKVKEGQTINEYCYQTEIQQGKNVADAAANVDGLQRFVLSSLTDTKKWSNGKYTQIYHFDAKAKIAEYVQNEYPELAAKMSIVQIGGYMNNWKTFLPKPEKQADGTYHVKGVGPGKTPQPMLHTEKDTGIVVAAALQSSPGKNILAAGSTYSWTDQFKVWCELNDVPFGGRDEISTNKFEEGVGPDLATELGEMFLFLDEFGYTGGDEVVLATELGVPCPLTTWEDYIKEEKVWADVLG